MSSDQNSFKREEHYLYTEDLPIHRAAYRGHVSELISLVKDIEDINVRSRSSCTALHLAIHGDQAECIRILLASRADPNLKDYSNDAHGEYYAAVTLAAWVGSSKALDALIEYGIDTTSESLLVAASVGQEECVRVISRHIKNRDFSDKPRLEAVREALARAALCWHAESVELLLTQFNDFPRSDLDDDKECLTKALFDALDTYTCIHWCRNIRGQNIQDVQDRLTSTLDHLISRGADINALEPESTFHRFWTLGRYGEYPDFAGTVNILLEKGMLVDESAAKAKPECYTPPLIEVLQSASDLDIVVAMVEAGASLDFADKNKSTPLHYARTRAIAEYLVNRGADIFAKNKQGRNPLHTASQSQYADVVAYLISKGADVHARDDVMKSMPLHLSSEAVGCQCWDPCIDSVSLEWPEKWALMKLETIKVLLSQGADIEARDMDGNGVTPLHLAVNATAVHQPGDENRIEAVRTLLDHGANIEAQDNNGNTSLQLAVHAGNMEAMRALIIHNADIEARERTGFTPLHTAVSLSSIGATRLLLEHGAEVDALTASGETALHFAWTVPIAETLLDHGSSLEAKNSEGATPLFKKLQKQSLDRRYNPGVFNTLVERGADRFVVNNEGKTVVDLLIRADWMLDENGLLFLKPGRDDSTGRNHQRGRGAMRGRGGSAFAA